VKAKAQAEVETDHLEKTGEAQAETYQLHQTGRRKVIRGRKKQSASRAEPYFKPDFRKEAQNGGKVKTRLTLVATT